MENAVMPLPQPVDGDVDIAAVGALLAGRGRCRVLMALDDGRALPAGLPPRPESRPPRRAATSASWWRPGC